MLTEKKCKGIGKAKGYGCGKLVPVSRFNQPNRVYGIGKSCGCYSDWLINSEYGKELIRKTTLKVTKPRLELERAAVEHKEKKSLPYLLKNTTNAVHTYIKKRDKGKPCISCRCSWHSDFQAGHFFKAELYSSLKFDYDNIHGQCVRCNIREEGNINKYSIELPKRIGLDRFEKLKYKASQYKKSGFKWDRATLIDIKYKAIKDFETLI